MNPYLIIGAMLAIASAGAGGFWFGSDYKEKSLIAEAAKEKEAYEAGMLLVAGELARVKIVQKNTTNIVEKEIREKLVYTECKHSPEAFKALNEALVPGGAK